jgi:hypothetical protein
MGCFGPYSSPIANFIFANRNNPNILPDLEELDREQMNQPSRYLLKKTIEQWTSDRLGYLRGCWNIKKNPHKLSRLELQVMQ